MWEFSGRWGTTKVLILKWGTSKARHGLFQEERGSVPEEEGEWRLLAQLVSDCAGGMMRGPPARVETWS